MTTTHWIIIQLILAQSALIAGLLLWFLKKSKLLARLLLSFTIAVDFSWLYRAAAVVIALSYGIKSNFADAFVYLVGALIFLAFMLALWGVFSKKAVWIGYLSLVLLFALTAVGHLTYMHYLH